MSETITVPPFGKTHFSLWRTCKQSRRGVGQERGPKWPAWATHGRKRATHTQVPLLQFVHQMLVMFLANTVPGGLLLWKYYTVTGTHKCPAAFGIHCVWYLPLKNCPGEFFAFAFFRNLSLTQRNWYQKRLENDLLENVVLVNCTRQLNVEAATLLLD